MMGGSQAIAPDRPTFRRRGQDVVLLLVGFAVLALTAIPIDAQSVGALETDLFRLVNDLPGAIYGAVWPVMQLGNVIIAPVLALVALITRRFRLAAAIALSGFVVWLLAKVVKDLVERGRPAELLEEVLRRGAPRVGQGYPSGHAAVAVAIAVVVSPYLSRPLKAVAWTLAAAVCVARVYVGAHLPLDVLGGAAFGLAIGALCNLVLGTPVPPRAELDVRGREGQRAAPTGGPRYKTD
jgi:membrane-associated phospholipid phosphatase